MRSENIMLGDRQIATDHTAPIRFSAFGKSTESPTPSFSLLFIGEQNNDFLLVETDLCSAGIRAQYGDFHLRHVKSLPAGVDEIRAKMTNYRSNFDALLVDVSSPDEDEAMTFDMMSATFPELPVILLSDEAGPETAIKMVQAGAQDFIPKWYLGIPELMARTVIHAIDRKSALDERKHLEEQVIQAEKLDSIGRIAAGVAHEVRNPLATIQVGMTYLNSIRDTVEDENFVPICEELTSSVKRALGIISGMVDFSRNDNLCTAPGTFEEGVKIALNLIRYEIIKSHTVVKLDTRTTGGAQVLIDYQKFSQVLINLIHNSIHAMVSTDSGRKCIVISTFSGAPTDFSVVPGLATWADESDVRRVAVLEIRDTGPGVPEEKLAQIFEPFSTTKARGEGTGLGLSVVLNLVKLHGGLIRVRNMSNPGGLRTRIYLKASE